MARSTASMAVVFIVSFLLVSLFTREASAVIACGAVASSIAPCIPYVTNKNPLTRACCSAVSKLNSLAQTTADRQAACNCLKNLSGKIPGLNPGLASGLPGKCGVNVPYPISTSTDCTKVH